MTSFDKNCLVKTYNSILIQPKNFETNHLTLEFKKIIVLDDCNGLAAEKLPLSYK